MAGRANDGWLSSQAAYDAWLGLGGCQNSANDRLAWERSKLRAKLSRHRVSGFEELFERRGGAHLTEIRIALKSEQIECSGLDD